MKRLLRSLCAVFFGLALGALAWLLLPDLWSGFRPSARHPRAGALALASLGLSFVCLQLGSGGPQRARAKGVLLGLAFVLWGAEPFLPAGPTVNAIDAAVITLFVADLGLVIAGRLRATPQG